VKADMEKQKMQKEDAKNIPENGFEADAILAELTAALGMDPAKSVISAETAKMIAPAYSKLFPKEETPEVDRQQLIKQKFFGAP